MKDYHWGNKYSPEKKKCLAAEFMKVDPEQRSHFSYPGLAIRGNHGLLSHLSYECLFPSFGNLRPPPGPSNHSIHLVLVSICPSPDKIRS